MISSHQYISSGANQLKRGVGKFPGNNLDTDGAAGYYCFHGNYFAA
jgi:hypothetical protein